MACGLPVIASNVGGVADQVADGETGFLVPPADPDALAVRIGQLLCDANLRERMGQAGLQKARTHYTLEVMAANYLAFYHLMLLSARSRNS